MITLEYKYNNNTIYKIIQSITNAYNEEVSNAGGNAVYK